MFDLAKQFAEADEVIIAAPFWDLSFPAALKQYFEQINVLGIPEFRLIKATGLDIAGADVDAILNSVKNEL